MTIPATTDTLHPVDSEDVHPLPAAELDDLKAQFFARLGEIADEAEDEAHELNAQRDAEAQQLDELDADISPADTLDAEDEAAELYELHPAAPASYPAAAQFGCPCGAGTHRPVTVWDWEDWSALADDWDDEHAAHRIRAAACPACLQDSPVQPVDRADVYGLQDFDDDAHARWLSSHHCRPPAQTGALDEAPASGAETISVILRRARAELAANRRPLTVGDLLELAAIVLEDGAA